MGTIILSAIVAHTAWHWMLDRGSVLRQFRFAWPVVDAALLATVLRSLLFVVILAGILWLFQMASRWWTRRTAPAAMESMDRAAGPLLPRMDPDLSPERPN